jgi:undecaprenyl-diphosphatase
LCFSILVGISRIALRYHYASDVLAGFCFGFAWVFIFFLAAKKISEKRLKKTEARLE